jgi:hypothetical protein
LSCSAREGDSYCGKGKGLPVIACEWSAGHEVVPIWWREKSVAAAKYIRKREI